MLTTLLLGTLHAAPPPATPEGAPRIEGLRTTWVTPSTWVPSLRPGRPLPQGPAMLAVRLDPDKVDDPRSAAERLRAVEGVAQVQGEGHELLVFLEDDWVDLGAVALADDQPLSAVADVVLVPRPRVLLPGSSGSPGGPIRIPLPGSSESPIPPAEPTTGPSPQTGRPFPPPAPADEATGWDLVIHNPYLGGPSKISIETLGLGEVDPNATVVLHDVQPGVYEVGFETPIGAKRTRSVPTTPRE
jgi:hypothetical protein